MAEDKERRVLMFYANRTEVKHESPMEIVFRFGSGFDSGEVVIINSPLHAKLFLKILEENILNYERSFGEIKIPEMEIKAHA